MPKRVVKRLRKWNFTVPKHFEVMDMTGVIKAHLTPGEEPQKMFAESDLQQVRQWICQHEKQ